MPEPQTFIQGESRRTIDDRFRLTLPTDMAQAISDEEGNSVIAKERFGCLSLWRPEDWHQKNKTDLGTLELKWQGGRMGDKQSQLQRVGRLYSTRFKSIQLANRSRILLPEGFRELLGVQPSEDVMVVGAWICVEVWNLQAWIETQKQDMPEFENMLSALI